MIRLTPVNITEWYMVLFIAMPNVVRTRNAGLLRITVRGLHNQMISVRTNSKRSKVHTGFIVSIVAQSGSRKFAQVRVRPSPSFLGTPSLDQNDPGIGTALSMMHT